MDEKIKELVDSLEVMGLLLKLEELCADHLETARSGLVYRYWRRNQLALEAAIRVLES